MVGDYPDIIIGCDMGNYDYSIKPFKIFIPSNSLDSRKLASLIINNLKSEKFDSASVIPSESVLWQPNKPSLFIQIGNKNFGELSLEDSSKIADAINTAIKKYYEKNPFVFVQQKPTIQTSEREGVITSLVSVP